MRKAINMTAPMQRVVPGPYPGWEYSTIAYPSDNGFHVETILFDDEYNAVDIERSFLGFRTTIDTHHQNIASRQGV